MCASCGNKNHKSGAKAKALEGKKIVVDYSKTNKGKEELKHWGNALKRFNK